MVERHLSLVYHLVGSIESDAVRSEERLLVYQFDIVFRHEIVTGEGFRHYVLQVGCHTLRHIEQCVVAELCLKVGESSPCRIRITEKQRVDVAGVEIEDVLGVYRSVLLLVSDVLINLVDNLLCVYISLTCCDRLVVGAFQRYLHAYVIVCVISVWHYGVVVHLGISQLRHIVYCSQLQVCRVVCIEGMAWSSRRSDVVAGLVADHEITLHVVVTIVHDHFIPCSALSNVCCI